MIIFNKNSIMEEISKKDKKVLSIYHPSPLTGFPHHFISLSILLANEKFGYLLANYYIQLFYNTYYDINNINYYDIDYFPFVFDFFPNMHFVNRTTTYLKILELNNKEIEIRQDSIIDNIVNWINNGYYLYFNLNEGEIPGTSFFKQKIQSLHPIFIFGYDKSQKILKSINYDSNQNVSIIDIAFDDFEKAFVSPLTKKLLNAWDWGNGFEYVVNLYKRKDEANIELNPSLIRNSLIDYIKSRNFYLNYDLFFPTEGLMKWGMETYHAIELYLNNINPKNFFDYRIFFGLFEHKKLMSNRINCLENNQMVDPTKQLLANSVQIEAKANILKKLSTKYSITREPGILEKMKEVLMDIRDKEESLINGLLLDLEKNI